MMSGRPSSYLFGKAARGVMENFLDHATLFAFDLDGTLTPIVPDPGAIAVSGEVQNEIALLGRQALVAVITGRSRPNALRHLQAAPHFLIGNHGAEGLPGWEAPTKTFVQTVKNWQDQLAGMLPDEDRKGVVVENKGATLSIHYRHAPDPKKAHEGILQAINRLVPLPRRIGGIFIENLLPKDAPDKGFALTQLMRQSGCPKAFFAGDDETDEDVFRLDHANIFTVRVGNEKASLAQYYLKNQKEIGRLLREINRILEQKSIWGHKRLTSTPDDI
jgi:trehalose 6-phosphate phosphatase